MQGSPLLESNDRVSGRRQLRRSEQRHSKRRRMGEQKRNGGKIGLIRGDSDRGDLVKGDTRS